MADVYQKPNSPYWYCDFNVTGRPGDRVRKSTKRKNRKEAQRVANQWEKEALDRLQFGISDELSLEQALGFYLRKHAANPRASEYEARVRKILDRLDPNMGFHELTYTKLLDYQSQRLAEGASKQTINHEMNAISAAYNMVSLDYRVRPGLKFPRFKIKGKSRHLADHEVKALLAELDPKRPLVGRGGSEYIPAYALGQQPVILEQRQQNYDLVICLLDTGCRMGELTAVTWDLVNTEDWTFRIDRTKNVDKGTSSERDWMVIYPTTRVKEVLARRHAERGNNPYVFPKWKRIKDGRWLRDAAPQRSTKAIRRAMDKVGINSPTNVKAYGRRDVRSLRDTFATRLAANDVDLNVIQDLLGHASPVMTRKYADVKLGKLSKKAASS